RPTRLTLFPYTTLFRSSLVAFGCSAENSSNSLLNKSPSPNPVEALEKSVDEIGASRTLDNWNLPNRNCAAGDCVLDIVVVSDVQDRKSTRLNSSHVKIS